MSYSAEQLALFRKTHGSSFDPNSAADRKKMADLPFVNVPVAKVVKLPAKTPAEQAQPTEGKAPAKSAEDALRARIIAEAKKCVGWKEKTGKNDGPEIDLILESVGLKGKREPYCAAFNYFVYKNAGAAKLVPGSAWSPDWVVKPTWTRKAGGATPKPGAAFGIYFESRQRIGHTGLIVEWNEAKGYVITIEGNTSGADAFGTEADREGSGVFMKKRKISEIHSVRDWVIKPK